MCMSYKRESMAANSRFGILIGGIIEDLLVSGAVLLLSVLVE